MRSILRSVLVAAVLVCALAPAGWAAVSSYSQDFEALNQGDTAALGDDGWVVYGNVFTPDGGTWIYGYGPYPAPNDGGGFCAIATGEGGGDQGSQQLSVYSDYNNGDHGSGNLIESIVYREQTIEAGDVGKVVLFRFDAKFGNLEGSSEAEAFIKTLDPASGYATTNHVIEDMTTIPSTWGPFSIQFTIDGGLVGQLLQFGFTTRAANYEASGVLYDNVDFQALTSAVLIEKWSSFDPSIHDHDGDGYLTAGDTLVYGVVAENIGGVDAPGIVVSDTPDPNTTLIAGSVSTGQGVVVSGNTAGDTTVSVDVGTLAAGALVTVTFEVMINDPLSSAVTQVENEAALSGDNIDPATSNIEVNIIGPPQRREPIPTLSTWGAMILVLLLAGIGAWKLRH